VFWDVRLDPPRSQTNPAELRSVADVMASRPGSLDYAVFGCQD
jgi:hypothetical protein